MSRRSQRWPAVPGSPLVTRRSARRSAPTGRPGSAGRRPPPDVLAAPGSPVRARARTSGCHPMWHRSDEASDAGSSNPAWFGALAATPRARAISRRCAHTRPRGAPVRAREPCRHRESARWASRNWIEVSCNRRTAKPMARADDGSSHWTSSTATSTGPAWARARKAFRTATPMMWSSGDLALGLLAQQRHPQGPPLGRREVHEDVIADGLEEVAEARVGERCLGIGRPRLKHPARSIAGPVDRGLPQGRLAHPGLAIDEQDRSSTAIGEEGIDRRELGISPNDGLDHDEATSATLSATAGFRGHLQAVAQYRRPSRPVCAALDAGATLVKPVSCNRFQRRGEPWRRRP